MRNRWIAELQTCTTQMQTMLTGVPYTQVVYANPVWTVADILCNIAYWEEHAVRSVTAFRAGGEYAHPDFSEARVDAINAQARLCSDWYPDERAWGRYHTARTQFIAALQSLDAPASAYIRCPWDERLELNRFVEHMIAHDLDHQRDIRDIIGN
jgi:hypothetical protein